MTERDRLAAALRNDQPTDWDPIEMSDSFALAYADRLIAAGVGFRPEPVRDVAARLGIPVTAHPLPDNRAFADDYSADLDVERLARALAKAYDTHYPHDLAAAIAAAYREEPPRHAVYVTGTDSEGALIMRDEWGRETHEDG